MSLMTGYNTTAQAYHHPHSMARLSHRDYSSGGVVSSYSASTAVGGGAAGPSVSPPLQSSPFHPQHQQQLQQLQRSGSVYDSLQTSCSGGVDHGYRHHHMAPTSWTPPPFRPSPTTPRSLSPASATEAAAAVHYGRSPRSCDSSLQYGSSAATAATNASYPPQMQAADYGALTAMLSSAAAAAAAAASGSTSTVASTAASSVSSLQLDSVAADAAVGVVHTGTGSPVRVRVVKRRVSANRKERRRTHSINSAFSALRGCIPNVPSDTKLSKIKTLRLATSYIAYLMDILNKDDPAAQRQLHEAGFKADISRKIESREERRRREAEEILKAAGAAHEKPTKGRTGWPQQVWAAELKQ